MATAQLLPGPDADHLDPLFAGLQGHRRRQLVAANVAGPNRATVPGPSDVAAWKADRSSYGAYDMAGNVSEWTASFDADGTPVVKGGNFGNENADLTRRILHLSPLTRDARIGFRTAVDDNFAAPGPSAGL